MYQMLRVQMFLIIHVNFSIHLNLSVYSVLWDEKELRFIYLMMINDFMNNSNKLLGRQSMQTSIKQ